MYEYVLAPPCLRHVRACFLLSNRGVGADLVDSIGFAAQVGGGMHVPKVGLLDYMIPVLFYILLTVFD